MLSDLGAIVGYVINIRVVHWVVYRDGLKANVALNSACYISLSCTNVSSTLTNTYIRLPKKIVHNSHFRPL